MASALAAMSSSEPASLCEAGSSCINWVVTSAVPPAVKSSSAATKGHFGMVSLLEVVEAYRTGLPAKFRRHGRSEEHTSELQSLMRISYAVFCLKKKIQQIKYITIHIYYINT